MSSKKIIPLPKLKKKAQEVFNKWIRNRDKDCGCISCGGSVDHAGHYFSSGQFSALTFDEVNVNSQCLGCNNFRHGNLIQYRFGLIEKYGVEIIEELEAKSKVNIYKWSRQELEDIITTYKL